MISYQSQKSSSRLGWFVMNLQRGARIGRETECCGRP